jgi:hypothetical protein
MDPRLAYGLAILNFVLMTVSIVAAALGGSRLLFLFAVAWALLGLMWLRRARRAT